MSVQELGVQMEEVRVQVTRHKGQLYSFFTSKKFKIVARGSPTIVFWDLPSYLDDFKDYEFVFTKSAFRSMNPRKWKMIQAIHNVKYRVDENLYELRFENLERQRLFRRLLKENEAWLMEVK